jgi:hypothetical protein
MSSIVIAGDTSGSVTLQAPAVAGATILTLPATSGTVQTSGAGYTTNGVAYASSTSALTTGSMLVFDSSDRLIVGAGSAVIGNRMEVVSNTSSQAIGIRGRASDGTGVISWHPNGTGTENARIQSDNTGVLIFGTGSSATERARITSAGDLLLGTTSTASKLTVASEMSLVTDNNNRGIIGWDNSLKRLSFGTINASTAYFDSVSLRDGNLLVGATSTAGNVVEIYNNSNQGGRINFYKTTSGNFSAIGNYYNGSYVGGVNYDNSSTSFPTSSDVRLKKDIFDASSASAKIDQIRIVSHGWKHDSAVVEFGVVAQELVNVAPQAVAVGDDGEEIETTWGVDYSKLVPLLIKAHQELKAEFDAYKASHP